MAIRFWQSLGCDEVVLSVRPIRSSAGMTTVRFLIPWNAFQYPRNAKLRANRFRGNRRAVRGSHRSIPSSEFAFPPW